MNNRRSFRNIIVNRKFQLSLTANILLLQLFGGLAFSIILVWIFLQSSRSIPLPEESGSTLAFFLLLLIIANIFVTLWAVRYTHAIAGPILKTTRYLKEAAEGLFPDRAIRFRKHDLFKRIGKEASSCVLQLKASKEKLDNLEAELITLRLRIDSGEEIQQVKAHLDRLIEQARETDVEV